MPEDNASAKDWSNFHLEAMDIGERMRDERASRAPPKPPCPAWWLVKHTRVAVRALASREATLLDVFGKGSVIRVARMLHLGASLWLLLEDSERQFLMPSRKASSDEAWMLAEDAGLGTLIEPLTETTITPDLAQAGLGEAGAPLLGAAVHPRDRAITAARKARTVLEGLPKAEVDSALEPRARDRSGANHGSEDRRGGGGGGGGGGDKSDDADDTDGVALARDATDPGDLDMGDLVSIEDVSTGAEASVARSPAEATARAMISAEQEGRDECHRSDVAVYATPAGPPRPPWM